MMSGGLRAPFFTMDKRLLSIDPLTGVQTWHYYDPVTDVTTFESCQDIEPIINMNKSLHNTDYQKKGIKEDWMHAAQIPVIVQERWLRKFGVNIYEKEHWPWVKRLLNDPEFKYLKTGSCKL